MILTKELVAEKIKQMMDYTKDNFGLPNGDDFPEMAKIVAESEDLAHMALLHFIACCLSQSDFNRYLAEMKDSRTDLMRAIPKHGAFRSYLDAIYLGFLLGKSTTEIELLDKLNSPIQ